MLLGRREEQRALARLLTAARASRSRVLALVGEPGIGKSALLDDLAASAGGMRILRARGIESEAAIPFGGLLELLRPALRSLERIPAPQAAALEGALALRPGGRPRDRFAVGAATLSLLAAFAEEEPLLVLVDDAHWLDGATAEALLFAMRRLVADPIAVTLAVRSGEPSLLDGSDVPALRLAGLDRGAAGDLLHGVPAAAVERLYEATAGNPLALLELAADAHELAAGPPEHPVPVPASLARSFLRRAASLTPQTRRALLLAATSDTGDLAVLARAGLDVNDLTAAERIGLVRVTGSTVEFRHPLVRSAVYGEAAPDERRAAHRALAQALPDRDSDRRAWHLASAAVGVDGTAAAALEHAGRRARASAAYGVASLTFERAARLHASDAERGRLLYESGDAAWLGGEAERARSLLDEARALDPHPRVDALRGEIAARRGPVNEGYELLVAAAERASPEEASLMLAEAADACFYAGAPARMLEAAERAVELAADDGPTAFYAVAARGVARVLAGGDGAPDLRRALGLFEMDDLGNDPRTLFWASVPPIFLREVDTGRKLMARAVAAAREHTAIGALPRLLNRLARDESVSDRWADAEVDFHETIRLAQETGQRTELAAALAGLAWLEARQGREESCRVHAAEGRALCIELGVGFYELWTYTALGELELGLGRPAEAIVHLEEHERRAQALGLADVDMSVEPELVDARLRLGQSDAAAETALRHAERARAKGMPWAIARAERCLGMVAPDYEAHFEAALEAHAQTPDLFATARTELAYGVRLRRERHRVRAREQLRAALATFDRLGPSPWADAASAELAATGETAHRRNPSALAELTPQELQIARLLGDGKTTREAAVTLFLSPKTIEYHLRGIYRKLGINSREALARAVAERRDVPAR
ncbi:MAG TPA: AAA family ATPase [Gaiellaceae bacterium]|nr:AAA family ATPase [Gaiellaceae bacterium]